MKPNRRITRHNNNAPLFARSTPRIILTLSTPSFWSTGILNGLQSAVFIIPRNHNNLLACGPREDSYSKRVLGLCKAECSSDLTARRAPNE